MKQKYSVLFMVFAVIAVNTLRAQDGWIQTGINPQYGYSLYSTGTEIYAATKDGVFSTVEDGMPWFSRGLDTNEVYNVIKTDNYILAATPGGVYRSSDNGTSWLPTNGLNYIGITAYSGPRIFAQTSSYTFVTSRGVGVFRSGNEGENWQQVFVGTRESFSGDIGEWATCIFTFNENIFIGVEASSAPVIYYSSDNGDTWTGLQGQFLRGDGRVDQIRSIYNDNGRLFACCMLGVYLSTDSGMTWIPKFSSTINQEGQVVGLSGFRDLISYNNRLIAAVDFNSIQISDDDGMNWTGFNDGLVSDWTFAALTIKPPYLWALRGFFGNVYRRQLAEIPTGVEESENFIPASYLLYQNYPNPFNPKTKINFIVRTNNYTSLRIYDLLGREVATLVDGILPAGEHTIEWNAQNFPSGVYFYRLQARNFTETRKMIILK
ncbi:MAG: T9SS type A sorting domain-containing protein [Bacteroidetes bacterium]|nr:T9SS type A sorting domain-containing protein [Bacteroidota bacterium]